MEDLEKHILVLPQLRVTPGIVKVGDRKMLSAGLVITLVMSVLLVITCHVCQARRFIVKKWTRSEDDGYSQSV